MQFSLEKLIYNNSLTPASSNGICDRTQQQLEAQSPSLHAGIAYSQFIQSNKIKKVSIFGSRERPEKIEKPLFYVIKNAQKKDNSSSKIDTALLSNKTITSSHSNQKTISPHDPILTQKIPSTTIECSQFIQLNKIKKVSIFENIERPEKIEKPLFYVIKNAQKKDNSSSKIDTALLSNKTITSSHSNQKTISSHDPILTQKIPSTISLHSRINKKLILSAEEKRDFKIHGLPDRIWEVIDDYTWNDWRRAIIKKVCSSTDQAHKTFNTLLCKYAGRKIIKGNDYANEAAAWAWKDRHTDIWDKVLIYCKQQKWINKEFTKLETKQWNKILLNIKIPVISIASNKSSLRTILNTIICRKINNFSMKTMDGIAKKRKKVFYSSYDKLKRYWFPSLIENKILEKIDNKLRLDLMKSVKEDIENHKPTRKRDHKYLSRKSQQIDKIKPRH